MDSPLCSNEISKLILAHLKPLIKWQGPYHHLLCHPDDKPTIGLLLVREKNRVLVEYALGDTKRPITVAEWETKLTQSLPENLKGSLPSIEEIEAELSEKQPI